MITIFNIIVDILLVILFICALFTICCCIVSCRCGRKESVYEEDSNFTNNIDNDFWND